MAIATAFKLHYIFMQRWNETGVFRMLQLVFSEDSIRIVIKIFYDLKLRLKCSLKNSSPWRGYIWFIRIHFQYNVFCGIVFNH